MGTILVVIFGALTGSLISVLVGLVGARRRIGFGWAFILSLIFTPLVGLLFTLISDPLPGADRRWGCFPMLLVLLTLIFLASMLMLIFMGGATVASLL